MRRAANIDRTHADIVNALRGRGCSVLSLAALGKGVPDLLVSWCGDTMLVEVKSFPEHTVKGKLNPAQQEFKDYWTGRIEVIRSFEDIGRLFPIAAARGETA